MKEEKELNSHIESILPAIYSTICSLSGSSSKNSFENFLQNILREAGFQDVIKQSSGPQGGFDISARHLERKWRFEAKKKHRGQVLNLESLSLPIILSAFLRAFLSLAMVFEALRTAWDTADSLILYP